MPTDTVPAKLNQTAPALATPPHPLDAQWWVRIDDSEYGPYTGHDIGKYVEDGRIDAHSEVRRENGGQWIEAIADAALSRFFKPKLQAPQRRAESSPPPVKASGGSTVVQVTNMVQQPSYIHPSAMGADKSPGVALLLSLIFVGAGQLYNGDVGKGILMFFMCVFLWMVLLGWIINLWSMIDAYSKAKTLKQQHQMFMLNARVG